MIYLHANIANDSELNKLIQQNVHRNQITISQTDTALLTE